MKKRKLIIIVLAFLAFTFYTVFEQYINRETEIVENIISEDKTFTSKDEVALYIKVYKKLPNNYITKKQAANLGYVASKANLWDVTNKMSIGGDRFFNRENLLPDKKSREYYEADIDFVGGYRNDKRIVYSNDGLIYYTADHYDSFTLLYGDE